MSLHKAAKHLETKGRNGDSMLVHMTPGEVRSLQTLAKANGGSLTINPATGLAEASFLKNLLPMIAGAALSPFITPMGAAAVVGGVEGLRTGDIGRGLTAGLGAFGGANLAGGLSAAATPAATTSAVGGAASGAPSQLATLAEQNAALGLTPAESAQQILSASPNIAPTSQYATLMQENAALGLNPAESMAQIQGASTNVFPTATPPTTYSNMMSGAKNLYAQPDGFTNFLGNNKMNLAMSAAPAISEAMTPKPIADALGTEEKSSGKYLSENFQGYEPRRPNPYYRPTGLGYAAEGGLMPNDLRYAVGGPIQQQIPNGGLAGIQGMRDAYGTPQTMDGNIPQMADGGSIGGYSDGGRMLKGPGDGMSDSIPATIGRKQPARLADGEFVVPADVVSHLGNGSTDAGAKRLYSMMDNVRKARTGTKKQGKQIKAEKYLPVKKMADGGVTGPAPSSSIVSPQALAGLADLSALGSMISNTRAPSMAAPMAQPSTYNPAVSQIAATTAARPASEAVSFNLSGTPKTTLAGYSNIRPDMLIDPAAAGWAQASVGRRGATNVPAGAETYTDPNGGIWYRT